jgi:hypothetical protein
MSKFEQTGDGAVQTSVEDLLLWDRNFYHPKVGGPDFLKRMHELGAFNSGDKHDYASGLFIDKYKGLNKVSHGGSWAGYRSDLLRFPDRKLSVVCLCNTGAVNPSALALQVADLYLAGEMPRTESATAAARAATAAIELSEAQMKDLAGVYRNAANGEAARIQLLGGKLYFDRFGLGSPLGSPLIARAADRFSIASPPGGADTGVAVERTPAGTRRLRVSPPNRPVQVLDSIESFAPAAAQLADFAGGFHSEELDATYVLSVEGGALQVANRDERKRPLLPTYKDSFALPAGAQFEFQRDGQGRVSGFVLHAGRIRNVKFARK